VRTINADFGYSEFKGVSGENIQLSTTLSRKKKSGGYGECIQLNFTLDRSDALRLHRQILVGMSRLLQIKDSEITYLKSTISEMGGKV
jgi:hypothetical protein